MKILDSFFIGQRATAISGLTINLKSFSIRAFYFIFARWINNNFYDIPFFGFGAIVNRYNSNFSIYSASEDKKLYSSYDLKKSLFINLGSGGFHHKYWDNYDYPAQSSYYKKVQGKFGVDYFKINLCGEGLKGFKSKSIDLAYMSHTLEHIEFSSGEKLFSQLSILMKEKGIFRIAIPDIDSAFHKAKIVYKSTAIPKQYKNHLIINTAKKMYSKCINIENKKLIKMIIDCDFNPEYFANLIKRDFNSFTKFNPKNPENHITYWNCDLLLDLSKKYKFNAFRIMNAGESIAKPFTNRHLFDTTESQMSIYFDISKSL